MTTLFATEIAAKFAHDRPGSELIDCEEVAIPYFRVTLDSVIQRRKPIPPLEEYVLRAIEAGIDTVSGLSGFLGLDEELVKAGLVSQLQLDNIDYRNIEGAQRAVLTARGRVSLVELGAFEPDRMDIAVDLDRLTWSIVGLPARDALRPVEIKAIGLRTIPAKHARRPSVTDLLLEQITSVVRSAQRSRLQDVFVLAVRGVVRVERIFRPALMLIYQSRDSDAIEVGFAVDGRPSPAHEYAFAEIGGPSRLTILGRGAGAVAADDLAASAKVRPEEIAPDQAINRLNSRLLEAEKNLEKIKTASVPASPSEAESYDSAAVVAAQGEIQSVEEALASIPIRRVKVYEHAVLFHEALLETEQRLLIISPWISAAVVNLQFLQYVEVLCRKGVRIHIGYGLDDRKFRSAHDREAEERLASAAGRFPHFTLKRLGYTHAKVLVWDQKIVVTSFNWLSFRGDANRTFRQEEGLLITVPETVNQLYEQHVREIESGSGHQPNG